MCACGHLDVLVVQEVAELHSTPEHCWCYVPDDLCSVLLGVCGVPFGQADLALPAQQEHELDSLV